MGKEKLEIGDVVYLKSGGKPMTIVSTHEGLGLKDTGHVGVMWMGETGVMHSSKLSVNVVTKTQQSAYYLRYASISDIGGL